MPLIHLTTKIYAPLPLVFDLARNIDFHQESASETQEKAIAGRTSGLMELGETVTWQAMHFGIKQRLTTQLTAMNAPHSFRDEMIYGAFKSIKHEHFFYLESASTSLRTGHSYHKNTTDRHNKPSRAHEKMNSPEKQKGATIMVDLFHFQSPLGIVGKLANVLFLKQYMSHFLRVRNEAIKRKAESRKR